MSLVRRLLRKTERVSQSRRPRDTYSDNEAFRLVPLSILLHVAKELGVARGAWGSVSSGEKGVWQNGRSANSQTIVAVNLVRQEKDHGGDIRTRATGTSVTRSEVCLISVTKADSQRVKYFAGLTFSKNDSKQRKRKSQVGGLRGVETWWPVNQFTRNAQSQLLSPSPRVHERWKRRGLLLELAAKLATGALSSVEQDTTGVGSLLGAFHDGQVGGYLLPDLSGCLPWRRLLSLASLVQALLPLDLSCKVARTRLAPFLPCLQTVGCERPGYPFHAIWAFGAKPEASRPDGHVQQWWLLHWTLRVWRRLVRLLWGPRRLLYWDAPTRDTSTKTEG